MKEVEKKKSLNGSQKKRSVASERRDRKLQQDSGFKTSISKETDQKTLYSKPDLNISVGDSNAVTESSAAYQDMVIHYVDDTDRVEVASQDLNTEEMVVNENKDELNDQSVFLDKEQCLRKKEEESDSETGKDLASYKGDAIAAENEKFERPSTAPARPGKNGISKSGSQSSRLISDRATSMLQSGAPNKIKKGTKSMKGSLKETASNTRGKNSTQLKFPSQPSSKFSENRNEKPLDDVKEVDILEEFSNGADTAGSDVDTVNSEENGSCNGREDVDPRIEEMESRIEKLEEELREIAVLEISLYSAISEHGSSAHKMHTPARRLSRLYIHACKYWSQDKRASFSRNTVSGLVLVSKSCSNDVPRLTFWLSNTVVLRENISQTFGSSCNTNSISRISELNGDVRKIDVNSLSLKWKGGPGNTHDRKHGLIQFMDDWQETRTFTAALENIESWIFSRIVESIWWQTFTPNMQSTLLDSHTKVIGRLLGPALGDQQQGKFSINHWNNAYRDASRRLCPVRAGGHECGCLPVLARMVIEQCVSRLDVAMFNAILRESAHEIPTDPVSDPIVDSKVLPIPAGDLSFGSGAQLKNSVGNWSRSLFELFGTSADCSSRQYYNDNDTCGEDERKHFNLLNSLSDLLMLPKDMLLDSSIRKQVCPSISLPLVRRILCNFTPDEFCPDPVPGAILEAVNTECIVEQSLSRDASSSFPYNAAPVVYTPPSLPNVAEKVVEAGGKSQLARNASVLQRKGYTSDEELDELDLPLTSIIDNLRSPCDVLANGNQKSEEQTRKVCRNARYKLLREVW